MTHYQSVSDEAETPGAPDQDTSTPAEYYEQHYTSSLTTVESGFTPVSMGQTLLANFGEDSMRLMQNTRLHLVLKVLAVFMTALFYDKTLAF